MTDAMKKAVEVAARVLANKAAERGVSFGWERLDPEQRRNRIADAEAALTAALPLMGIERALLHKAIEEFIYDRDGLAAWLTDRRNQSHSDGDTWSKGWHDANEEALAFVREVSFKRSSEATDAAFDCDAALPAQSGSGVQCREDVAHDRAFANGVKACLQRLYAAGARTDEHHQAWEDCEAMWRARYDVALSKPAGQPVEGCPLVTERDMQDAKGLGERSGIDTMDDWDEFMHDIAQTIANGRRAPTPASPHEVHGRDTQVDQEMS